MQQQVRGGREGGGEGSECNLTCEVDGGLLIQLDDAITVVDVIRVKNDVLM